MLEYADVVWDNLTIDYIKKLESIQLEAVRIICGATKLTSHDALYRETGIEPLQNRRLKHKLIQFHKIIHEQTPNYLRDILPGRINERHAHNTRRSQNIVTLPFRTTFHSKSFFPSTINSWNNLPSYVKENPSVQFLKLYLNNEKIVVPSFYNVGKRICQIYHARLRLKCSSLREHLYNKNLVENPFCNCGQTESVQHYLLECRHYIALRQQYIYHIQNITVKLLLYGDTALSEAENADIFKSVQIFIMKSKRFDPS